MCIRDSCGACGWFFAFKNHPQYAIELSRAKQQFQMVRTFNQVLQGMQVQSKMLEKISFRLDGLEGEVSSLKENIPLPAPVAQQAYEYPALEPIQKATDFDTAKKRQAWWTGLEAQWQKAFNQGVLQEANDYQPTDKELVYLLTAPTLRLVGPKAMHPSIDFELTNLSGIKHLTDLTMLIVSNNALVNLAGIEHLDKLMSLFVNANKLTNIRAVYYLPQLKELYLNVNQLTDIQPVAPLTNLTTLYCCYNRLTSFQGLTSAHVSHLKAFTSLPNDEVSSQEIKRLEQLGINCKKG